MSTLALRSETSVPLDGTAVAVRSVGRAVLIALGIVAGALLLWCAANVLSTAPASAAPRSPHHSRPTTGLHHSGGPTPPPPPPSGRGNGNGNAGRAPANRGPAHATTPGNNDHRRGNNPPSRNSRGPDHGRSTAHGPTQGRSNNRPANSHGGNRPPADKHRSGR